MDDIKSNYQKYHSHITSDHKWFDLKLGEVWKYRDLIWLFTKRSFIIKYKQTILGPAWLFLSPILTSLIYTFVFGGIAGMSTDGIPHILFYLSSTAIWTYFSTIVYSNSSTFTANANVFGKVYFPRLTMPVSVVISAMLQFFIQMILVIAFLIYYGIKGEVSPNWWALPMVFVVLLHLGIMGLGVGIIISSMTTKYRDLSILVGFGVSLWMYATPIVYPLSQLGNGLMKTLLMLNPVTTPVEVFRYALFGKGTIHELYLGISVAFTLLVAILGIMVFNKVERTFMDTV